MNQKEFFNSLAEKWDTICNHDTSKIKCLLGMLNIFDGAKILDVGTGTGVLIPFLTTMAGNHGKVIAIDVSDKMLEVAQRKYQYENVSFVCDDVLETDIYKSSFDFIICYSMFPHFSDKQSAIAILSTYLKKYGKLIICHSQSREAINNLHKNASEVIREDNLPSTHIINTYFETAGLFPFFQVDNEEMFAVIAQK